MDRGAWWATVHGVAKSQTRLSDFTFTFHFYALEKEMATHSSVLAWRIPQMGEPGGLPSMGSHRVGHDWSDLAAAAAAMCVYIYTLHIYHILFICSLNRDKKFSSWTLRNSLTGRDGQGSFRTLEGNSAATDAQKAKQREFTTEIIADQHFPAEKWFAHPLRWMGAGCWGCSPRERTGVECCEDTLKGLVQQSGGSPGKSLGLPERSLTPHNLRSQELTVVNALGVTGHSCELCSCRSRYTQLLPTPARASEANWMWVQFVIQRGECKPAGHCESQGECPRQEKKRHHCGPNPRDSSCPQAVTGDSYCPCLPRSLCDWPLSRDTGLRADSLGRVHDPPQTGATSRRPGLQKALPKHPSYGFHTPLSPWPDWASEP